MRIMAENGLNSLVSLLDDSLPLYMIPIPPERKSCERSCEDCPRICDKMKGNTSNLSNSPPDNSRNMMPSERKLSEKSCGDGPEIAFLHMILQPKIVRDLSETRFSMISILCSVCERIGRYLFLKITRLFPPFLSKLFLNLLLSPYYI